MSPNGVKKGQLCGSCSQLWEHCKGRNASTFRPMKFDSNWLNNKLLAHMKHVETVWPVVCWRCDAFCAKYHLTIGQSQKNQTYSSDPAKLLLLSRETGLGILLRTWFSLPSFLPQSSDLPFPNHYPTVPHSVLPILFFPPSWPPTFDLTSLLPSASFPPPPHSSLYLSNNATCVERPHNFSHSMCFSSGNLLWSTELNACKCWKKKKVKPH